MDHPDDLAAGFFAFILHADDIAHFQFRLNAIDACTGSIDVLSHGVLEKRLVVRSHPPYFDLQVQSRTRR
jgi:hypothetical protein